MGAVNPYVPTIKRTAIIDRPLVDGTCGMTEKGVHTFTLWLTDGSVQTEEMTADQVTQCHRCFRIREPVMLDENGDVAWAYYLVLEAL